MKMYALYRRNYVDFDMARDVPIAVSSVHERLLMECEVRNAARTKEELDAEVGYFVSNKKEIKVL